MSNWTGSPHSITRRALLAGLGLERLARAQQTSVIRIDPAATLQTFEGWGTSLCWWANIAGRFPQKIRDDLGRQIFTLEDTGLGFNIVRFNIGGGENPAIQNTMEPRARMEGYWPGPNRGFEWDADRTQRAILEDAIRFSAASGTDLRVETFSNSPPWWMTVSRSTTGNTGSDGAPAENLAPEFCGDFALYLRRVTQHLEERYRLAIETISPFNEPTSRWWKLGGRQEGCFFTHAAMAKLVAAFEPVLSGTRYRLAAPEDWSIAQSLATWNSFDSETKARVGRINTHSYDGTPRAELFDCAHHDGKRVWMSEYGDGDASGNKLAATILKDLTQLRASAWINWQVVLPGSWGMIRNNHVDDSWTRSKKFYVMAHFSRFMRPGSRILSTPGAEGVVACRKDRQLVIVVHNPSPRNSSFSFDLSACGATGKKIEWHRTDLSPNSSENLVRQPDIPVHSRTFSMDASPQSLSTFILETEPKER